MAVIRIVKDKNYITMGKYHLQEKEMSLKAVGLLSVMLSLPDNWDYSVNGLSAIRKESRNTINEILQELEQFGYLTRTRIRDEKGKIKEIEYIIFECPHLKNQDMDNQDIDNQDIENCIQLNNKQLNNKIINKLNNNKYICEFEELWKLYPKKVGKKDALRHYIRNRRNNVSYEKILKGLNEYNEYIKINKIQTRFIKDGSTWFNQESWNDERKVENTNNFDVSVFFDNKEELKQYGIQ